jgi:hypothetical protein
MHFIPIALKNIFSLYPNPTPGKTFWGVVESEEYLRLLNLSDLINEVYILSIWLPPGGISEIHKDQRLDGSGVNWSWVIPLLQHEEISIEIFDQTNISNNSVSSTISMAGGQPIHFLENENATLIDSWDMKNGSCVFDAYNKWHRVVNRSNHFINLISIRSYSLEMSKLISYLSQKI